MPSSGCTRMIKSLGKNRRFALLLKQRQRRRTETHHHFAELFRQHLSGAQVKRRAAPTPVVDEQF